MIVNKVIVVELLNGVVNYFWFTKVLKLPTLEHQHTFQKAFTWDAANLRGGVDGATKNSKLYIECKPTGGSTTQ